MPAITPETALAWLQKREKFFSLAAVADELHIPARTLRSYVTGERGQRGLPPETAQRLADWIENEIRK